MGKMIDLSGERFGKLSVLSYHSTTSYGATAWKCKCDCGKEVIALSNNLRKGSTKSCGCAQHKGVIRKHGQCGTRLYSIWCGMKRRCNGINTHAYADYGGRGISVCAEWVDSFETFKKWAAENGYTDALSIDRIDNDGNYSPENCKWATRKTQCRNRRSSTRVSYGGKNLTLPEWEEETGIKSETMRNRINNLGWSVEKALTTPIHK